jgi:hypothetical protein
MRRNGWLLSAAVAGLLVAAAGALAHGDDRPQVDPLAAEVVISHIEGKSRSCEGQDGMYVENRNVVATGTSTGDSRLAGTVRITWDEIFNTDAVEPTDEAGPFVGRIVIRDSGTGRKKAEGEFNNAGPLDMVQGVIAGSIRDQGAGPDEDSLGAGRWISHWRIIYGENGSVAAQIGGEAPDTRFPSSVDSGSCRGPFEPFEGDVPPPETVVAATASGVGGSRVLVGR